MEEIKKCCGTCYWQSPNFSLLVCRYDGKPVAAVDGEDCAKWKDAREYENAWQEAEEN